LHPGGEPVDQDRLAGVGHLGQALAKVGEGHHERAVRLAQAERGQFAEQQVEAVAHLGLGDADHAGGASVRQPVEDDRGDGVHADLQGQRRVAA
jgi:hypothetical protein